METTAWPTADHDRLLARLGLDPAARILDVGGGGRPFAHAAVVVDRDLEAGSRHRDGAGVPRAPGGRPALVRADIQALPFADKSFDFVICLHVLEHVADPRRACGELMRVAPAGFIEVPRKWTEYYAGHPTHRWLISEAGGGLVFEPVTAAESPFLNFALPPLWDSPELRDRLAKYTDIPCVQLAWEGEFPCTVAAPLPAETGGNRFMARRHYHFARNILYWLGDLQAGAFHAREAAALDPAAADCRRLAEFYHLLTADCRALRRLRPTAGRLAAALAVRLCRRLQRLVMTLHRRLFFRLWP
ncbi:MAG: class I SAM-dependent methyltransferase [Deltaproteobacteria bacterium]|nr:class I SAM-dependent methyltransferase [Candidatus Anaeroferrophillacea bacterium]